jgi:DNA-binding helix-hairpin-helix protein with protein kinase domain
MQAFFAEKNSIKADGIAARGPATAAKLNAFGIQTGLDLRSQSLALQANELRVLVRRMNVENPLWGAPRIHVALTVGITEPGSRKFVAARNNHPSTLSSH